MRIILIYLLACFFILSGCSNLRGTGVEDGADQFAEQSEDNFEDSAEDSSDEFIESDEYEENEDIETAEIKSSGVSGFFKKLFASDEAIPDEEGYEEDESDDEEEYGDITEEDEYTVEEGDEEEIADESDYAIDEGEGEEEELKDESDTGKVAGFFKNLFSGDEDSDEEDDSEYADLEGSENETSEDVNTEDEGIEESQSVADNNFTSSEEVETAPKNIPLQKIRRYSYQKGSYLVNAVYIARPGDNMASVSQKLYGSDQTSLLYEINPHLRTRSVKVGDKIYYSSSRQNNKNNIMFYYNEVGLPASTHVISAGQNIREVAYQLLGHPNSWKEIWATNFNIESKGIVSEDITISYFPRGVASSQAPAPQQEEPQEQQVAEQVQEQPQEQQEEPQEQQIADQAQEPTEPPQFPEPESDFPQIKDPSQKSSLQDDLLSQVMANKKMIGLGLGGLIFIILIFRILAKKRRQSKDFDYTAF